MKSLLVITSALLPLLSSKGSKYEMFEFEFKTLPEGYKLYHATAAPEDEWNVEDLSHGMWFSNKKEAVEFFVKGWQEYENPEPRIIELVVREPIELIVLDSSMADDFEQAYGFFPFLSPDEIRDDFQSTNLEGWFIDSNYGYNKHDIFIKFPSRYLEIVNIERRN